MENENYGLEFCEKKLIPIIKNVVGKYIATSYIIEKKGQGNFVTTIDRMIEEELIDNFQKLIPDSGILAEEKGGNLKKKFNWIIDPIDGTTNFINGLQYAVSVALVYEGLDKILIGVVYNPKDDIWYYGCKGKGSYVIENGIVTKLRVKKFPADEGIIVFGMPYDRRKTKKILDIVQKYYTISSDMKRIGPSSLDICLVASGKAKMYIELDLNLWDIAAGILILMEAGGSFIQKGDLYIFGNEISHELPK
nr:inositol monophosphatase family protein [uncultured Anaerobutyricum sp.]